MVKSQAGVFFNKIGHLGWVFLPCLQGFIESLLHRKNPPISIKYPYLEPSSTLFMLAGDQGIEP